MTATTVEKMFGIVHGAELPVKTGGTRNFEVVPSRALINQLLELRQGKRVGIETFDPRGIPESVVFKNSDGSSTEYWLGAKTYWEYVTRACESADLEVVYLDDFPTWKDSSEKIHRARYMRGKQANEATYQLEIEGQYQFQVGRERIFLENIQKYSPHVVILGRDHADYLMQKPRELTTKGISVGSYQREGILLTSKLYAVSSFKGPLYAHLETETQPNPALIQGRESLERKLRAVRGDSASQE